MQYWDIVTRSFRISWRRRYLWVLALFSGESGAGAGFNYSQSQPATAGVGHKPDFGVVSQQFGAWINQELGLLSLLAVLSLVLVVGFFILAAACEAAVVRASAEHDAERPFDLRLAWQAGLTRMWAVVRFRLLIVALGLPLFVLFFGLVFGAAMAGFSGNAGAAVALIVSAALVILVAIPYLIYLSLLDRLGARSAVLELAGATAALRRGHRLIVMRLGRVLAVWLIAVAVAIVVSIGLGIAGALLVLPVVLIGLGAAASGSGALWAIAILGIVVVVPIVLVAVAFLAAQSSTYWTLAFRRLDLEPLPVYGAYPPQAPTPDAT